MILAANRQLLLNGSKRNAKCGMRNAKFEYQITNFEFCPDASGLDVGFKKFENRNSKKKF